MICPMIGWSRRARKLTLKRTGESSKERDFFTRLVFEQKLARNTSFLVEKHQCFGFTQGFLFSFNCFTSICRKSENFYLIFQKIITKLMFWCVKKTLLFNPQKYILNIYYETFRQSQKHFAITPGILDFKRFIAAISFKTRIK
jgi:hypothetical protein